MKKFIVEIYIHIHTLVHIVFRDKNHITIKTFPVIFLFCVEKISFIFKISSLPLVGIFGFSFKNAAR